MEQVKSLIVGIISGILAYLRPLDGEFQTLFAIFTINFLCGLLAALIVERQSFKLKKAFRCITEAAVFFLLVCCIYWVGEHKGNPDGALQCVSFVTYSVIYFYSVNILRNVKSLLPSGTLGRRVISFLYYVVSVEFVKKIPYLATYLGGKEDNNDKTVGEESK
jgi:multisubunit Na+/H+ antiporter MnhB subunit